MPQGDVEVFHEEQAWRFRIEGESMVSESFETKEEAVDAAREEAQNREVELIIRNMDGQIGERDTEGHDPRDIPG